MNKIFCVSCGSKMEYGLTKPRFCSSCGQPTGSQAPAQHQNEYEEEEVESSNINIEQLKDTVQASHSNVVGLTLGSLLGTAEGSSRMPARTQDGGPKGKALLKLIQEECASSRNNPKEVGE